MLINPGYTRRKELTCTLEELSTYGSVVLYEGEALYVLQEDGRYAVKFGDGKTPAADLPYSINYSVISPKLRAPKTVIIYNSSKRVKFENPDSPFVLKNYVCIDGERVGVVKDGGSFDFSDFVGDKEKAAVDIAVAADGFLESDKITSVWKRADYTDGLSYTLSEDGTHYICSGIGTASGSSIAIANDIDLIFVTAIGLYAFECLDNLTSITIPDSVTDIGEGAFSLCTGLMSVIIGSGLTRVGRHAFERCGNLMDITVDADNTSYKSINGNLYTKDGKTLIQYAIGKTDTSFIIPDGVTRIGEWAFSGCSNLTSITIPDSVTKIGEQAFEGCDNLKLNEFDNAYYIGDDSNPYAVLLKAKDYSITACKINANTKFIYDGAFAYCERLTTITIPNGVVDIGAYAFESCYGLTSITIPDSVTSLAGSVFNDCPTLDFIYVPWSYGEVRGAPWGAENAEIIYNHYN